MLKYILLELPNNLRAWFPHVLVDLSYLIFVVIILLALKSMYIFSFYKTWGEQFQQLSFICMWVASFCLFWIYHHTISCDGPYFLHWKRWWSAIPIDLAVFYTGLAPSLNQVQVEYVCMLISNSNKNSLKPLCSPGATEQKFWDVFLLLETSNSELHKLEDT